jgi:hypothetical protein
MEKNSIEQLKGECVDLHQFHATFARVPVMPFGLQTPGARCFCLSDLDTTGPCLILVRMVRS